MRMIWLVLLLPWIGGCGNSTVEGILTDEASSGMLFTIFQDATGVTMTNAAVAGTEISSNASRAYVNLTGFTEARGQFSSSLTSAVVQCRIEFSLDNGGSWSVLVPSFAASTTANAASGGTWADIPNNGATDVLLRAVIVGNGVLDPVIRYVRVEVR